METSEAMTSSTDSFAYSYRLFKKCFIEEKKNLILICSLFFPIYINLKKIIFLFLT